MKKILSTCVLLLFFCLLLTTPFSAGWKENADGSWSYSRKGKTYEVVAYFPDLQMGIVRAGKYCYCYNAKGRKVAGLVKNGSDWYFFSSKKGRMAVKKRVKIDNSYYYFDSEGKRVRSGWVKKRYYGKNGKQVFSDFVGPRYVNSKGKYVTGLKKIGGDYYYFDQETGFMVTGCAVTVKKKSYYFNDEGKGKIAAGDGTVVEDTYFSDPEADDEELLAAIIYCEAGNQPYYGQLAVGLVITNRVRSKLFPNKIKEVIYAKQQFEPCRNGVLTAVLKGKIKVTASCRKAAKKALSMFENNKYKIRNAAGKKVSMKNYLFFMTPAAYKRLGIKSKCDVLWDHVFFKEWKR